MKNRWILTMVVVSFGLFSQTVLSFLDEESFSSRADPNWVKACVEAAEYSNDMVAGGRILDSTHHMAPPPAQCESACTGPFSGSTNQVHGFPGGEKGTVRPRITLALPYAREAYEILRSLAELHRSS